jgi:hypothetical protein
MTHIDIVFAKTTDPNPDFRFVEVEDASGASICAGEWIDRGNWLWALRFERTPSIGRALAMRVLQSDLYFQLDEVERGECDALIHDHLQSLKAPSKDDAANKLHLPCPICNGSESCDHTYPERIRAEAALAKDKR